MNKKFTPNPFLTPHASSLNSSLSDEERKLFQDAVFDVKPLHKTDKPTKKTDTSEKKETLLPKKVFIKIKKSALNEEPTPFSFFDKEAVVTGEDILSFKRHGLQHKQLTTLRQGKNRIEATLDLHEHTIDQAIVATDQFLKRCYQNGYKNVCIIHGKGLYSSDNKPIIKNLLNSYLRQHPLVLAFHSTKNKHGGTGALYVIIKG